MLPNLSPHPQRTLGLSHCLPKAVTSYRPFGVAAFRSQSKPEPGPDSAHSAVAAGQGADEQHGAKEAVRAAAKQLERGTVQGSAAPGKPPPAGRTDMQAAGQDSGKQGIAGTQSRVPGREHCQPGRQLWLKPPEVWAEDAIYQEPMWKTHLIFKFSCNFHSSRTQPSPCTQTGALPTLIRLPQTRYLVPRGAELSRQTLCVGSGWGKQV